MQKESLVRARREEIMAACLSLYQTKSFKEISMKEIGLVTSFTRTSIYNYFQTKEEIFLAIFQREYELWNKELECILECEPLSRREFAVRLTQTVANRPLLLKLLAMNMYDMEENSRQECLVSFKSAFGRSFALVRECLSHHFPQLDSHAFQYSFFPFMIGIYPYVMATKKQRAAMQEAGVVLEEYTIYSITYNHIAQLLRIEERAS